MLMIRPCETTRSNIFSISSEWSTRSYNRWTCYYIQHYSIRTMAFVPGHKHDLFLSYAHKETAWVEAFSKALCDEFHELTGKQITVWNDSQNLRLGQKWTSEIE